MKTYAKFKSRFRGFSLVELMIGIVVLGVLLSFAAPAFNNMILDTRVRNAAESVLNGLQRTRALAVSNNTSIEFTLFADSSWNIDYTAAYKTANSLPASPIEVKAANEGTKDVAIISLDSNAAAAATRVTFDNLGRVLNINADGSPQLAEINFSTPKGNRPMRVIIGTQTAPETPPYVGSNPKMCDPGIARPNLLAC